MASLVTAPRTKVLLTGASGFIGRHCLEPLLARFDEVHIVTRSSIQTAPSTPAAANSDAVNNNAAHISVDKLNEAPIDGTKIAASRSTVGAVHAPPTDKNSNHPIPHKADLKSEAEAIALIDSIKPTHLLHLAWTTETGACLTDPDNEVWEKSGMAMVQAFHDAGGKRIVVSGTCAEYDWNFSHLSEDSTPTNPRNLYGKSKNAFREKLLQFSIETGLSSAWGRIFFVYGAGEDKRRLVASVITNLLAQLPAECTHGEQKRDYLYVQDVADALVALLTSDVQGTVNIGSGKAIKLKDLISAVAAKLNGQDLIRLGARPVPPDDPPCLVADIQRLSNEVGFTPRISVDQGLDSTIDWWRQAL